MNLANLEEYLKLSTAEKTAVTNAYNKLPENPIAKAYSCVESVLDAGNVVKFRVTFLPISELNQWTLIIPLEKIK